MKENFTLYPTKLKMFEPLISEIPDTYLQCTVRTVSAMMC